MSRPAKRSSQARKLLVRGRSGWLAVEQLEDRLAPNGSGLGPAVADPVRDGQPDAAAVAGGALLEAEAPLSPSSGAEWFAGSMGQFFSRGRSPTVPGAGSDDLVLGLASPDGLGYDGPTREMILDLSTELPAALSAE